MKRHVIKVASTVLFVAASACAADPPPPPNAPRASSAPPATLATETTTTSASDQGPVKCDLVCEGAQLVRESAQLPDYPDYHQEAVLNANQVLEGMHDDLLACYTKRLASRPAAHGFITVDIVIAPDGRVRNVDTTGGALLGEGAMACIVRRIQRASFLPVHGGGTRHIHVPFSLRRIGPEET